MLITIGWTVTLVDNRTHFGDAVLEALQGLPASPQRTCGVIVYPGILPLRLCAQAEIEDALVISGGGLNCA